MNLPIGNLIQGASQARNAYVGGQRERQQDDLANALMARKLEQEAQQQSLRDALTRSQITHTDALTQGALTPKVQAPQRIDPNSPEGIAAAIKKAEGLQALEPPKSSTAQRNIDPLSQEGIAASAARARAQAEATAQFRRDPREPAPRPPSEIQTKASLVYDRAKEAANIIDTFGDKAPGLSAKLGEIPLVGSFLTSSDQQRLNNAGEVLATAVLRLESGAAVSKSEAQSYARQFLPQPGDSPDLLKQKREIRSQLVERIRTVGGNAITGPAPAPAAAGGSKEQQLWDAAVAKHGKAKVEQTFGPRPK